MLPDPTFCHTRPMKAFDPFAMCLVEDASACPYLFGFEKRQFCLNPAWKDFLKE